MHAHSSDLLGFISANWKEILGFLTGAVCVWLLVKENIWNWPIGIANNIFYIVIFTQSGLYADAGLQFVYIAISIYGWWNWLHGGRNRSELNVSRANVVSLSGYLAIAGCSTALLFWILHRFTDSTVPLADGLTTALFLTAQYMMSRKVVENWWFWIVGDALAIALYIYKHLYLTSALYAIFLVMCIMGLLEWQKSARRKVAAASA
jgi:nicotinamide mononucleotide transporter